MVYEIMCDKRRRYTVKANRRTIVKGMLAAGALPLFNIGCAYRKGWEVA